MIIWIKDQTGKFELPHMIYVDTDVKKCEAHTAEFYDQKTDWHWVRNFHGRLDVIWLQHCPVYLQIQRAAHAQFDDHGIFAEVWSLGRKSLSDVGCVIIPLYGQTRKDIERGSSEFYGPKILENIRSTRGESHGLWKDSILYVNTEGKFGTLRLNSTITLEIPFWRADVTVAFICSSPVRNLSLVTLANTVFAHRLPVDKTVISGAPSLPDKNLRYGDSGFERRVRLKTE